MTKIFANKESDMLANKTEEEIESKEKSQVKLFKNQIVLNPSISKLNLAGFVFYGMLLGIMPSPMDVLQLPLLGIHFNLMGGDQDTTNTILLLCDLGTQLLTAPLYGYLCNRLGRKVVVIFGLTLLILELNLIPLTTNVFPQLLLVKLMGSNGISALQVIPLVADYFDYQTRGKMSGFFFVCQEFGSIILTEVYQRANLSQDISWMYHLTAIIIVGLGILITLFIKGGKYHEDAPKDIEFTENPNLSSIENRQVLLKDSGSLNSSSHIISDRIPQDDSNKNPGLFDGIKQAKNPWILIGYMLAFISMANYGIIAYVNVGYITTLTGQENSASQGYLLMIINYVIVLTSSIGIGYLCDKYSKRNLSLFAIITAIVGSALIIIFPDPYGAGVYISAGVLGLTGGSTCTISLNLVSKYPAPKYRAAVYSTNFLCELLGTMFSAILGVYLLQFDLFLPYYLYLGVSSIFLIISVSLFIFKRETMK